MPNAHSPVLVAFTRCFVTTATATLLSRDSELLGAQVESHRDEQESVEATPRGVRLRVNTLKGP